MKSVKDYLVHIGKTEYEAEQIMKKSKIKGSAADKAVKNIKSSKKYWLFKVGH